MNGMIGPSRSASVRLIIRAVSVEPVKTTPGKQGMRGQCSTDDPARARCELDDVLGNAGLMHELDRKRADQRGLAGRLGDHGIARGQRRRDQAGENREREIPRGNAREYAAAVQAQFVLFAGRAGQRSGLVNWRRASAA